MKFIRSKLSLILISVAMLLFFTNDFGLVDIERTAIIVALGIDYEEEQNQYTLSAQIAIPQASSTTISNEDALVTGKGKTVAAALDNIGINTGWYPMLSFCNLILLGKTTLKSDIMYHINYFIRSDKIEDSAILAACDDKAEEVLSSCTPLDSISSLAIEKILSKDIAKSDKIADTDVKEFSKGYYSKSESGYMPFIRRIKLETKSQDNKGGQSGQKENKSEEQYIFDATETLIFKKGVNVGKLTSLETLFFNIKRKNSIDTLIELDGIEFNGKKTDVIFGLNESYKKYAFYVKDGKPRFEVNLHLLCQIEDVYDSVPVKELVTTAEIEEKVLKEAENRIKTTIENMLIKIKEADCDLFDFKETLYKFHYFSYEKLKSTVLADTEIDVTIKCKTEQSAKM